MFPSEASFQLCPEFRTKQGTRIKNLSHGERGREWEKNTKRNGLLLDLLGEIFQKSSILMRDSSIKRGERKAKYYEDKSGYEDRDRRERLFFRQV